ncbi:EcsC family protein [Dokdonia sp. Hel_I_53]|uniref:EcsC family protein n=1 Tax=Dokdonia sp. Hel_I_53 TaxID=1566287 RepID=UPI00119A443B|nr:EcsC family protein [Dokdonia sp. Hel_I_53]TVZ53360.1 EcsC family protein [Dokdonia sp. Hel_I_53]
MNKLSNQKHHITQQIPEEDIAILSKAKKNLTAVPFAMKALNTVGTPIEKGIALVPEKYQSKITETVKKALQLSVKANLKTLKSKKIQPTASNRMYKVVTTGTGLVGGFFGIAGLTTDILLSTKFLMRSIMDIARSQGEDITDPEVQLNCLQVFALGGGSLDDDALDSSYYGTRIALDQALSQVASTIAKEGTKKFLQSIAANTPGAMGGFMGKVISRYSTQVLDKFATQAIPFVGAATGAGLNLLFITHFQKVATAHFTVRRLERLYGKEAVMEMYHAIDVPIK